MSVWMIRAGRGGIYAASWLNESRIGISWDFNGKDISSMNREQIRAAWTSTHPDDSKNKVASSVGQVYRFAHDMERGQTIIIYDPSSRLYHIGTINGDCVPTSDEDEITYTRAVIWNESAAPRDALKQSSKNSLGGIQTVFTVSDDVLKDLQDTPQAARRHRQSRLATMRKTIRTMTRKSAPPHMTTASNSSRTV